MTQQQPQRIVRGNLILDNLPEKALEITDDLIPYQNCRNAELQVRFFISESVNPIIFHQKSYNIISTTTMGSLLIFFC
jgi:hypothetical protein